MIRRAEEAPVRRRTAAAVCALFAASVGFHAQATVDSRDHPRVPSAAEPITPLPGEVAGDADKVRLGERLFHDVRLSRGDVLACASCHRLAEGGDGNLARSPGFDGKLLEFNTPTVFNAALSFRLNWRGNFRSLEEQIEAVLLDSDLMNTSWEALLRKLRADEAYGEAFFAIYGSGPEPDRFDLILTDEIMPGMTGTQLASALHRMRPQLPILLMTGHGGPIEARGLRAAGVCEVLRKPLSTADIAASLARHLAPRRHACDRS